MRGFRLFTVKGKGEECHSLRSTRPCCGISNASCIIVAEKIKCNDVNGHCECTIPPWILNAYFGENVQALDSIKKALPKKKDKDKAGSSFSEDDAKRLEKEVSCFKNFN